MADFGMELFDYVRTLVPYWRVSDDAWLLSDESHLCGLGVLRNYGGQVMVMEWDPDVHQQLTSLRDSDEKIDFNRVVVVVDDRAITHWEKIQTDLAPVNVTPWSKRETLAEILIRDQP